MATHGGPSKPIPIVSRRAGAPAMGASHGLGMGRGAVSASLPPPKPHIGSVPAPKLPMPMPELDLPPTDPEAASVLSLRSRGAAGGVAMSAPAANFMHLARSRAAAPARAAAAADEASAAGGEAVVTAAAAAGKASMSSSLARSPTILSVLKERPGDLGAFAEGKTARPGASGAGRLAAAAAAPGGKVASGMVMQVRGRPVAGADAGAPAGAAGDPVDGAGGHPWEEDDGVEGAVAEGEEEDEEDEDEEDAVGGGVFDMS